MAHVLPTRLYRVICCRNKVETSKEPAREDDQVVVVCPHLPHRAEATTMGPEHPCKSFRHSWLVTEATAQPAGPQGREPGLCAARYRVLGPRSLTRRPIRFKRGHRLGPSRHPVGPGREAGAPALRSCVRGATESTVLLPTSEPARLRPAGWPAWPLLGTLAPPARLP